MYTDVLSLEELKESEYLDHSTYDWESAIDEYIEMSREEGHYCWDLELDYEPRFGFSIDTKMYDTYFHLEGEEEQEDDNYIKYKHLIDVVKVYIEFKPDDFRPYYRVNISFSFEGEGLTKAGNKFTIVSNVEVDPNYRSDFLFLTDHAYAYLQKASSYVRDIGEYISLETL